MVADESCVVIRSNTPRARTPREAGLRVTLADCDDPELLRRTGINLKSLHDAARCKAWEINPKKANRTW
jgi:hypothetical protein